MRKGTVDIAMAVSLTPIGYSTMEGIEIMEAREKRAKKPPTTNSIVALTYLPM